jgi:Uma2 family endonuclease
VGGESIQNVEIADALRDRIKAEIKRLNMNWRSYQNSIGVEVERSDKQERIPDILVINKETRALISRDSRIVTRDMPDPILVVEIVSPSSVKEDLEEKPFEYMERGVGEYVSIDWKQQRIIVWSRTDGKSYNVNEYNKGDAVITLESFPEITMTLNQMIYP